MSKQTRTSRSVPDPPVYALPAVVNISKDGKIAAVGGKDVELFLWSTETGELLSTLRGHETSWTGSNDSTFFVTTQEDSKASGMPVQVLAWHAMDLSMRGGAQFTSMPVPPFDFCSSTWSFLPRYLHAFAAVAVAIAAAVAGSCLLLCMSASQSGMLVCRMHYLPSMMCVATPPAWPHP
eukprot:8853-Pelagomonas_calceolata.AAC.1